ncbi:hypothetical protein ACC677_38005, partial [Rhizobium ruizarguesonis]
LLIVHRPVPKRHNQSILNTMSQPNANSSISMMARYFHMGATARSTLAASSMRYERSKLADPAAI